MKRLAIVIFSILLSASVMGQAKVGTIAASELLTNSSVESIGMAETGVAYSDYSTMFLNPANAGLFAFENKLVATGYLNKPVVGVFDSYSFLTFIPFILKDEGNYKLALGIGDLYNKNSVLVQITTPLYPEGTGEYREVCFKNYSSFVGLGLKSKVVEAAVGLNVKYYKEDVVDISTDGFAFDFGSVLKLKKMLSKEEAQKRSVLSGSIGVSYANVGSDVTFDNIGSYELPKTFRIGTAFSYQLENDYLKTIDITGTIEHESNDYRDDRNKYGLSAAVLEMVALRAGKINSEITTFGFSFSTIGLFKLGSGDKESRDKSGFMKFVSEKLNLVYNYANYNDDEAVLNNERNYHSLTLEYRL